MEATIEATTRKVPVTIQVVRDEDAENPRTAFDGHLGVFAGWHKRYIVGDIQPKEDPIDWLKKNAPKGSIILSVYMMDHGDRHYSTSAFGDPWDSGQVGFIVATPERICENYRVKRITAKLRAQIAARLSSEIQEYDDWANGNVWGFAVSGGGYDDSCYGFFGDDATLDAMIEHVPYELHAGMKEAWNNRFDNDPTVTVEVTPAGAEAKRLDAEDVIRNRARDILTAHGVTLSNVRNDAQVTAADGGSFVTVSVFVPKAH